TATAARSRSPTLRAAALASRSGCRPRRLGEGPTRREGRRDAPGPASRPCDDTLRQSPIGGSRCPKTRRKLIRRSHDATRGPSVRPAHRERRRSAGANTDPGHPRGQGPRATLPAAGGGGSRRPDDAPGPPRRARGTDLGSPVGALRGHGDSTWDPPWDAATHVADLLETLDAEGVERVAVIGHSFGGL